MVSQDKLIKNGIRYTDKLFDEISRRLEKGVLDSDTLEEFLRKTKEYTTNNPLVSTDYDKTMINIILAETNNHKFSRPAQKELVRVTIENKVGDLIRDVGEDIKQSVRDIVTEEYNKPEGSNPQKMAKQISKKVSGIKNKRAKTIARTEIARTATISDYIIASERGATHYTVTCRSTRCPICKKMYCKSSETGGDVEYEITDTSNLPPVHPNCRCSANFFIKEGSKPKAESTPVETTKTDLRDKLTEEEVEKYNAFQKKIKDSTEMLNKLPDDDPRRFMYERRLKRDKKRLKELEDIASNPDKREVTIQNVIKKGDKNNTDLSFKEISNHEEMADYFGLSYIEEVTRQNGKESRTYLLKDDEYNTTFRGLDRFSVEETKEVLRAYDRTNPLLKSSPTTIYLDGQTDIVDLGIYNPASNTVTIYGHKRDTDVANLEYTTNHEMTHAFDNLLSDTFDKFSSQEDKEYRKIVRKEGWSSAYSHRVKGSTRIVEDLAETGAMVLNKNNPNIKIRMPDNTVLTAKEWCEKFPQKTTYFEKLLKSKEAQKIRR